MSATLYKVLDTNGKSFYPSEGQWSLPTGDVPGDWMPTINGKLIPYKNGYHLCRPEDLLWWLGPVIYEAEIMGKMMRSKGKIVVRDVRLISRLEAWNPLAAIHFLADCAEHVLPFFEGMYPDDIRPRRAIEAIRRQVDVSLDTFVNAAHDAHAARIAADAHAADPHDYRSNRATIRAAYASRAADITLIIAVAVAKDIYTPYASTAAANAAANAASKVHKEREWQTKRLMEILYPGEEVT